MIKRLLTIAALVATTFVGAQAQVFQMNPMRQTVQFAPAKAASLDGTTPYGYGLTSGWEGIGIGAKNVTFDVAVFIPCSGALEGASINGINIPVFDAGMKNVSAWVRTSLNGTNLASATASGTFKKGQYFTVALDNAVPIPASGIYAGYTFTCSYEYPIAFAGDMVPGGLFLRYVNNGEDSGWEDYSNQFPASPLQVLLSGVAMPDYDVELTAAGQSIQLPNAEFSIPVSIVSNSANEIKDIDVDLTFNDQTTSQHIKLSQSLPSGFNSNTTFNVKGTSPAQAGRYDVVISVKKLNGTDYAETATATGVLKNLTKIVPRQTVIEEFTGTGCGYCPRGWAGMEYMKTNYPDRFIGIAFHKYNSNDAMYYANYPMIGLSGAPGCVIDRKEEADPYYGNTNDAYGIAQTFEQLNAELPEVDVKVKAQWNEDETAVNVDAEVEFLVNTGAVDLVYVLTADSLSGTTSAWKQSNYYSSYTTSDVRNAPGLVDFCSGGKYGQSSVFLVFNDVVIGSSYSAKMTNQGQTVTGSEVEIGAIYNASYTIASPTKTTIKDAIKKNLVTAAVLVVDNATGEVLNAGKAHVASYDPNAVGVIPTTESHVSQRYNAAGQAIGAPQRGLNIVRMSDGTVRKVLVK